MWKRSPLPFLNNSKKNTPLVIAHRGDSAHIPENTLQAFEDAFKLGVDCLETDVHITKDDQFVLFHDDVVDRTTEAKGLVSSFTLSELRKLDAGYRFQPPNFPFRGKGLQIQTLDEIFQKYPIRFNLDIKDKDPKVPELLALKLKELGVEDRVMVGSFHQDQIKHFRKFSEIPTSAGRKEVFKFWRVARKWIRKNKSFFSNEKSNDEEHLSQKKIFGTELPYYALQIPERNYFLKIITPELIKFAHIDGIDISIQVWTINNEKDIRRFLEWEIDGIFTDKPKLMLNILNL
ncbi:glycerophosphodiester phosphodiesterase [Promethearchaeum syntrophicum]|uniref:Glycerophosphodiester phosphodiesterase n=1 Tax=Promethearchaeum syntrophicum TaxID=2594042 RepID=A0A5B9D5N4_9ARCH|nr:glycerophosphodiester phosphodiesterase [Candidatus Prometheoarchaeum syntrophicum]QEE14372.1 cytoplasmic glycerophosphodiester phosphodiesterase [Candidatus Prometheoarchaeum syntrophicum]